MELCETEPHILGSFARQKIMNNIIRNKRKLDLTIVLQSTMWREKRRERKKADDKLTTLREEKELRD